MIPSGYMSGDEVGFAGDNGDGDGDVADALDVNFLGGK